MNIRRQDLGLLLLYVLGYSLFRNLILRCLRKPIARFVAFHEVPPESAARFRKNLHFLKKATNVVSLDDFFSGALRTDRINTVITFDDGYKSWVLHALPVLKELALPAIFFVSSGFVGLPSSQAASFKRANLCRAHGFRELGDGLDWEDLHAIADAGFEIGGHSVNHCDLTESDDITKLRYEIRQDRAQLEDTVGSGVRYFSYPWGHCCNPMVDLVGILRECGYRGAVTTVGGSNSEKTNPYLLRRELTEASMPGIVFRARVYGNYDGVQFLKRGLRVLSRSRVQP